VIVHVNEKSRGECRDRGGRSAVSVGAEKNRGRDSCSCWEDAVDEFQGIKAKG